MSGASKTSSVCLANRAIGVTKPTLNQVVPSVQHGCAAVPIESGHHAKRIPVLDGIRGIAILQVLIWHYSGALHPKLGSAASYGLRLLYLTWSGVDLFFVLSGFLIGGILLDHRGSANYFEVFYVRRFWRIIPIYIVMLLIGHVLSGLGHLDPDRTGNLIALSWYATFTQNVWMSIHSSWSLWLAQTWSLAIEEQFYVLLPVTIWLVA